MGALAVLWKKKGWKVTGSDVGFYPPISTHLKKHNIAYYAGWHPEKIGKPDLVVVGNVAGSENPEWLAVQANKIPYVSYPELIAQNLVKKNSIVCAGTYGKTSSTVLLSWILKETGYNPAYMFGGLSLNLEESADNPDDSEWSILEGDEYKTSRWDNKAKFFSYKPTHLLLTDIQWDHADVYSTEASYFEAFEKLVKMIPTNGLIVVSEKLSPVILNGVKNPLNPNFKGSFVNTQDDNERPRIIRYGTQSGEYIYQNIKQTKDGLIFDILHQDKKYSLQIPIIGEYMAENICGCFALASEIGIEPEKIVSALQKFKGIKRRLEKRGTINGADVFDDIAHSPIKAKYTLETLHHLYCHSDATGGISIPTTNRQRSLTAVRDDKPKIFAIFEPNTGNREQSAIPQYDQAFDLADTVIIPRLTKLKIKPGEKIIEGKELAEIISHTHKNVKYIEDDEELIKFIKQNTQTNDAIVFLGSHSFRGMIDELVK